MPNISGISTFWRRSLRCIIKSFRLFRFSWRSEGKITILNTSFMSICLAFNSTSNLDTADEQNFLLLFSKIHSQPFSVVMLFSEMWFYGISMKGCILMYLLTNGTICDRSTWKMKMVNYFIYMYETWNLFGRFYEATWHKLLSSK